MNITNVTAESFDEIINKNDIVVVDFWAEWCEPCHAFVPVFQQVANEYPDVFFGKVNIEEQTSLADEFTIRSIPTVMILRRKIMLYCESGVLPASALKDLIEQAKALDMEKVEKDLKEK